MDEPLLQWLTRGVFILVFCLTLVDFLRRRDIPRLEVAAVFGGLAFITALQSVTDLTGVSLPAWASVAGVIALLAQPFLQLRVLSQFRAVPRIQQWIGLVGFIGSCALVLVLGADLPTWATIAIVIAFTYVEAYASVGFVRAAVVHRGLSQRRLVAVAVGSGCLAMCIALAGAAAAIPSPPRVLTGLINLFALFSAVGYYLGMAPPRWVRRVWQGAEMQRFLMGLTGQSGGERVASVLDYLGPAAARATGGKAAVIGLTSDSDQNVLELYPDPAARPVIERTEISTLTLDFRSPVLSGAVRSARSVASGQVEEWGWELRTLAEALRAKGLLIAPITTGGRTYGLFIVFVDKESLFAQDDLAVLGVLADQAAVTIQGRQLLEESARERSTLNAVMSSMHEGLLVMDDAGVIRYCNARTEELLGIGRPRLIGSHVKTALSEIQQRLVDPEAVNSAWKRGLRNAEERTRIDLELTAPPKSVQAEVFSVADPDGARRGVGVVLRDVTTERDLVRTKDELVSVVSHELRTPLASVVGFAELLRTRELSESQRQQFLTVILEEGRRLTALINDFLDLQRMESGRQEIVPRPVEVAPLLEQCINVAGEDAARPIQLKLADRLPPVRADSDRISQVVTNLLSNARKYSPAGGAVQVAVEEADGQVILSVQDRGLGLPPEALPRLFEKFYRVDNTDRRTITGTGLGLAISRKIVEAHGGRIWAESDGLGQGSRFFFSLPVADAPSESGDVLIVEDDRGFARLLEAELENHGLSAVWVATAEEAFKQVESEYPKAIVLDLLLPGAQGEEFLERLRKVKGGEVPVIVITVKDLSPEERAAFDRLGVVATLRKESAVGATASEIIKSALRDGALVAGGVTG